MIHFYRTMSLVLAALAWPMLSLAKDIVHDAEYYILESQNGERWAAEDKVLDERIAALKAKHGRPPNIVHILWLVRLTYFYFFGKPEQCKYP